MRARRQRPVWQRLLARHPVPAPVRNGWDFLHRLYNKYWDDRSGMAASAIAFWSVLSLVPIFLLALSLLGQFLGTHRTQEEAYRLLERSLPGASTAAVPYLRDLATHHRTFAGIGLIGLVYAGGQIFLILELALNVTWSVPRYRHFLHSRTVALFATLAALGLLVLSMLATSTLEVVRVVATRELPEPLPAPVWAGAGEIVPFALTLLAFFMLYKMLPNLRVRWGAAALGAMVGGVLWEVAKRVFAYSLARLANYEPVYGSLGSLVGIMLWAYYSAVILLIGGTVGALYQRHKDDQRRGPSIRPDS